LSWSPIKANKRKEVKEQVKKLNWF